TARPLADRARPPTQIRWWPPPRLGPLHRGRSASPPWPSAMVAWGQTPRPDGRRFALPTRRCGGDWFDWFGPWPLFLILQHQWLCDLIQHRTHDVNRIHEFHFVVAQ